MRDLLVAGYAAVYDGLLACVHHYEGQVDGRAVGRVTLTRLLGTVSLHQVLKCDLLNTK